MGEHVAGLTEVYMLSSGIKLLWSEGGFSFHLELLSRS